MEEPNLPSNPAPPASTPAVAGFLRELANLADQRAQEVIHEHQKPGRLTTNRQRYRAQAGVAALRMFANELREMAVKADGGSKP